jgi:DNA-binding NtrC family response regulator
MRERVFIVDDDPAIRRSLTSLFVGEGYQTEAFADVAGLTAEIAPDSRAVLLLDIAIPGEDGMSFLERCRRDYPHLGVIMITGEGTIDRAVAATKLGAHDFLEKPLDPNRLLLSVKNLSERMILSQQLLDSREQQSSRYRLIGDSAAMRDLRTMITQVAVAESTVLIYGENGTGKELVAYQVFTNSKRTDKPYVKVNCAALPTELAEAELFGFRKGAFTGADRNRDGKFKAANGGTIFLDEIGDLSQSIQAKLLRILESGEIEPLGSDSAEKLDVRVLTATNRDLQQLKSDGRFREDLFYRLNVLPITVPPLRDRREDIPPLISHFAQRLSADTGLGTKRFSADAVGYLSGLDYPGNVRELRNIVERCFILTRGDEVSLDDVKTCIGGEYEVPVGEAGSDRNALTQALRNFEKSFLAGELERHQGNISELARHLGIDRGNLSRKLKGYGLG